MGDEGGREDETRAEGGDVQGGRAKGGDGGGCSGGDGRGEVAATARRVAVAAGGEEGRPAPGSNLMIEIHRAHVLVTAVANASPDLRQRWPLPLPPPAVTANCRDYWRFTAADNAVAVVTCEAEGRGWGTRAGGKTRQGRRAAEGGGVQYGRV